MTIADKARAAAIHCEMKKVAYRQSKDGIVVSFVLHPQEVPAALSTSHIGARYIAALVEIGDDEQPITQAEKEKANIPAKVASVQSRLDSPPAGTKREKQDWRDMKPSTQAAIRCGEAIFWAFLNEEHGYNVENKEEAAEAVRDKCGVISRKLLDVDNFHPQRVIWHQLDTSYQAWKALEHA